MSTQSSQGLDLKENVKAKATRASSQDKIIVKSYRTASTEEEAVSLTAEGEVKAETGAETPLPVRRIGDFSLASRSGIQEPIQGISADAELYLSGEQWRGRKRAMECVHCRWDRCDPRTVAHLCVHAKHPSFYI